jgi:three-Cys-motif partner protein
VNRHGNPRRNQPGGGECEAMSRTKRLKFDEIGYWSEIKLDIVKDYAAAYSRILAAQTRPAFEHVYIDAFAGAGVHVSKATGQYIPGSPVNALLVHPSFREYHLIDIDRQKVASLRRFTKGRSDVHIHEGDCNPILLEKVFPTVRWEQYRRGLCLLDPYGLHLNWKVIEAAGKSRAIDMFLNFPVADINRNVLWRHPEGVDTADLKRMDEFWGDESWREIAYKPDLLGYREKEENEVVAEGFRRRLLKVAGFKHVPAPLPMRNTKGATVYFLFLASQKPTAEHIITDIFNKYRRRGAK